MFSKRQQEVASFRGCQDCCETMPVSLLKPKKLIGRLLFVYEKTQPLCFRLTLSPTSSPILAVHPFLLIGISCIVEQMVQTSPLILIHYKENKNMK